MSKKDLLYVQIANQVERQIAGGIVCVGDQLPSLRTLARERGISLSTAQHAYLELESRGLVAARPQSGYYVTHSPHRANPLPRTTQPLIASHDSGSEDLIEALSANAANAKIALSKGAPANALLPVAKLNKAVLEATRNLEAGGVGYDFYGNANLKKQIAWRSLLWGGNLSADDIIPTAGGIDAISCCLLAIAKKGDTIAVESPLYHGLLNLANSLGLRVLELPTHPITGIEIEALQKALAQKKVQLCLLVSNFSNPLGSLMPDAHKKAVVQLLEKYNVPLVEDDLFGDLYFGKQRPSCCKTYDESGLVLLCNSFSKTLAPGYRVGWTAPGQFKQKVARTKLYHSLYSTSITHEAVGRFLENERYEIHLRKLRQTLHKNALQFLRCIGQYFPDNTRVTLPQGGLHVWVEFHKRLNTLELYNRAMAHRISIAPGRLFTLQNQYQHCLKLNFGLVWDDNVEQGLKTLGRLAAQLQA